MDTCRSKQCAPAVVVSKMNHCIVVCFVPSTNIISAACAWMMILIDDKDDDNNHNDDVLQKIDLASNLY